MRGNYKIFYALTIILMCVIAFTSCGLTPGSRYFWNSYGSALQKADDDSRYSTKKKVEDTCRSMISSYISDKLTYEQYRNSTEAEQRGWAEQAKMRANTTAASYNEYILKNDYVWAGNIPSDIRGTLEYIQ